MEQDHGDPDNEAVDEQESKAKKCHIHAASQNTALLVIVHTDSVQERKFGDAMSMRKLAPSIPNITKLTTSCHLCQSLGGVNKFKSSNLHKQIFIFDPPCSWFGV